MGEEQVQQAIREAIETGGAGMSWVWVAVVYALIEIIKMLINKLGKDQTPLPALTEEERSWIRDLHTWHKKEDGDGVKLWYNPRTSTQRLLENQEEIAKNMQHLAKSVEMLADKER